MQLSELRSMLKPWMLPIAMVIGLLFHNYMSHVGVVAPYLIFVMLFITFCRIRPDELRITRMSWCLLTVQVVGAVAIYLCLRPVSETLAQGVFICVFCPTATSAPVITGMLGGSIPRLATYSLVSNAAVALLAPLLFAMVGGGRVEFADSIVIVAEKVVPLMLVPLALALLLRRFQPKVHAKIASKQSWSFYLWALSLVIVVGNSVSFAMDEPADRIPEMVMIALGSLVACLAQFAIGRKIGTRCGDKIVGAQGLGQKNTVLAIWMALTYLNPISSIAPAAYIAWQNTINSLQLYVHERAKRHMKH